MKQAFKLPMVAPVACLALAASVGLPSSAFAQNESSAREDGLYFRLGAGATFASDWEQDFTYNPAAMFVVVPPTGQAIGGGNGFTAGAALGFDYADGIRTELEYRYAATGIDSITDVGGASAGVSRGSDEDISAQFVMANFYFDFYNQSAITPFIGGGVGGALVENELGQKDGALAYQGRAGLSLAVGGGFSADLEYIYLRTNDLVYGPADDDFIPTGPVVRADGEAYVSSSVMISLRKPF